MHNPAAVPALSFAPNARSLIKSSDTLAIIAPEAIFTRKAFPGLFEPSITDLLLDLASRVKPGDMGAAASTLTGGAPDRIFIGVLPNTVSRYNSPARPESVRRVVPAGDLLAANKPGILLVLDDPSHMLAATVAVGRAFPEYTAKASGPSTTAVRIAAIDRKGELIRPTPQVTAALAASRAVTALVDTPPTDLGPAAYAAAAKALLKGLKGVKIREIVGDALLKAKLAGIHTVGRCALEAPRMLIAEYNPGGRGKRRHIALVGKGITYDTGGLNLKIQGSMSNMKCDMAGSAALLGAFRVLVESQCQHRVTLVLCIAENAIGPAAYKPDDIIHLHSGKTVEINNTDAEGRLLLADGVSYAARELAADTIIDAATLTGAQLIATGLQHAVIVSNDDALERHFVAAGALSGDLVHPLPFAPEFFKSEFDSPVADMCNSVRSRSNAPSACAAQFVYWQIEDTGAKWLHIDLAGPAFPKNRATGFGVALVAEAVQTL